MTVIYEIKYSDTTHLMTGLTKRKYTGKRVVKCNEYD